jgi:pantothenate kinase-related protein Tda10
MAFTESELQAQLATDGLNAEVTKFVNVGATATDVYVQNLNSTTSRKAGWTQVAQTNTAAQAAALIRSNLTS